MESCGIWRGWGAAPRLSPIAPHGSQHWVAFFSFKSPSWLMRGAKGEEKQKMPEEEDRKRECGAEIAVQEHPIVMSLH